MGSRTAKRQLPAFNVGDAVRLTGDILRTPLLPSGAYGDASVLVPDGEIGQVEYSMEFGNYLVRFPQITLHVSAVRLVATEKVPEFA